MRNIPAQVAQHLQDALRGMRAERRHTGSFDTGRLCAIAITDLEKVAAYWRYYVIKDAANEPDITPP